MAGAFLFPRWRDASTTQESTAMADDDAQVQDEQREADDQDQTHETDDLGDAGKAALKREREARKAAEKEKADLAKKIADFEKAQQERDTEAAKAKGEWETIAKQREDELAALKAQINDRDLRDRKTAIAKAAGLPDDLAGRLQGETDDELEADAKALAKHLKAQDAPDNDAGKRTAPGQKKPDKSEFSNPAKWGLRTT
jgi:hypothetical protein